MPICLILSLYSEMEISHWLVSVFVHFAPSNVSFSTLFKVVVCKLTPMQTEMYLSFLSSDAVRQSLRAAGESKMSSSSLAAITSLKKLVNHPDLIYDLCVSGKDGFENLLKFFPPSYKQQNRRLQVDLNFVYHPHSCSTIEWPSTQAYDLRLLVILCDF